MSDAIPADLEALFEDTSDPDALMGALMEIYGKAVSADRCLMFLYEPAAVLDQEHNVYLQGAFTIVQFCKFGEPFADGQNIKDRRSTFVVFFLFFDI